MPREFTVTAIIAAYNEGDLIGQVIAGLWAQGVGVYLIDHGSSDDTVAEAEKLRGAGLIGVERFPDDSGFPSEDAERFAWDHLLRRKEALALELASSWFIHSDADEFRESPWRDVTLRDAIQRVDELGYNAIDFAVYNFWPTHDRFQRGDDVRKAFPLCERGAEFDKLQVKCWKRGGSPVDLASTGGHEARFPGRKVFPIRFLLRHYPIRGQAHGERKIFRERKARFLPEERARDWHQQYEKMVEGQSLLRDPSSLAPFDPEAARLDAALAHRGVEELAARHEEEIAQARRALEERAGELAAARSRLAERERELAASEERARGGEAARAEATARAGALSATVEEGQREAAVQRERLAQHEVGHANLREQLEARDAAHADLLAQLEARDAANADLRAQLAARDAAHAELRGQLEAARAELRSTVEAARAELRSTVEAGEAANADLRGQLAAQVELRATTEAAHADLRATMEAAHGDLRAQLAARDAAHAELLATLPARDAVVDGLRADRAALVEELERARTAAEDRSRADAAAVQARAEIELARDELRAARDAARTRADGAEAALQRIEAERRQLAEEAAAERDRLRGERDQLRGERDRLRGERDHLRGERDADQRARAALVDERLRAEERAATLEQRCDHARAELAQAMEQLRGAEARIDAFYASRSWRWLAPARIAWKLAGKE